MPGSEPPFWVLPTEESDHYMHNKMRINELAATCWLILLLGFGLLPQVFFNYGWNYWQFLPWTICATIFAIVIIVLFASSYLDKIPPKAKLAIVIILPFIAVSIFWLMRTRIHCFGGDGAVGIVPQGEICWRDFIPPMPGNRLDGYLTGVTGKLCNLLGLFNQSEVMPSILTTQIYTICIGTLFVTIACISLRNNIWMLIAILTYPYIFNFFGNIDSYAFSLMIALLFMIVAIWTDRSPEIRLSHLIPLCIVWCIGLWTHPFHVFSGFVVAVEATRFLKRFKAFQKLPSHILPILYGIILFIAIKASPWSNSFFCASAGETPPAFSADTLTHYLNMILLPIAPLLCVSYTSRKAIGRFSTTFSIFLMHSAIFFIMAFTLGAVDQFNYQHLLIFFITPWIVFGGAALPKNSLRLVACVNIFLLLPMIAVHSTTRTIDRAMAVYPMDPCKHNISMSWQTHLGLVLGDNLQTEPSIKKACLRVFSNGSRNANPPAFRGGNHIYHTAFLYHFGEFKEGREKLFNLLQQNPQTLNYFLGVRPAFIYCNRKRLLDDIELFIQKTNSAQINDFRKIKETILQKASNEPYYLHRPSYSETDI